MTEPREPEVLLQPQPKFEVRPSPIHGNGLFTTTFIPAGERVMDYMGETVDNNEKEYREMLYKRGGKKPWFIKLEQHRILDVQKVDGDAFYINHSCLPNMDSQINGIRHYRRVCLFANRNIQPGEELTFDFAARRINGRVKLVPRRPINPFGNRRSKEEEKKLLLEKKERLEKKAEKARQDALLAQAPAGVSTRRNTYVYQT